MSTINSDEHDVKHGERSGQGAAAGTGVTRQAKSVMLTTGQNWKSKEESVSGAKWRRAKRAGVQRRRTVSTDLHFVKKDRSDMYCAGLCPGKKNPDINPTNPTFPCSWYIPPFFEISIEGFVLSLPYFPRKIGTSKKTTLILVF
jgi:hypothetical protein